MEAEPPAQTRIVFYTESVGRGGAETALRNLLGALGPEFDCAVLALDPDVGAWVAAARPGTEVHRATPVRGKRSLAALGRLRAEISALHASVFHANLRTLGDAQYGLVAACSVRGLSVVAVEQLPYPTTSRLQASLKRFTSRRLAAHVAVGDAAAREVERLAGLRSGSVVTIHNGVPDRGPLPLPANPAPVVGTLARLDPIKGLDVLLEAVSGVPTLQVKIVGEGPLRGELEQRAGRLGIAERVRFVPWTDDAHAELADVDVFVLPSRNEGFPLSVVEAMLAARPVVATDVGSVSEAVDGRTGVVVPPDDVAALRGALASLAADPERRRALGDAGRRRALERFTDVATARRFEALYAELVRG